MNEEFVTFDIAKKLKEKGFNEECFGWYYPSEVCGFDYKTTIVFNHSEWRGSNYKDMLVSHNDEKHIDVPTISQVLKWLRNEREIFVEIALSPEGYRHIIYTGLQCIHTLSDVYFSFDEFYNHENNYMDYEQAALAGIEYVLDNLI